MKYVLILIILISYLHNISAQAVRETRAVWISTNYRLDWPPPTYDEQIQKDELIKIFDDIERKNLNTIYLQVRSNGTVLFKSSFDPFSSYLTGKVDLMGSYDPLAFAIEEAHNRGLEIHAWINSMRSFNSSEVSILENDKHVCKQHPYWLYNKIEDNGSNSFWLNPGLPEVRDYLIELINELVENYDIDGVQLDFIRYPKEPIDDHDSYTIYGNGENIDDWRRQNINTFVMSLNRRIKSTKPLIKLGVTPIGIYKNLPNARGLEGYSDVFQDSREWLRMGIIDYIVPQIYWNIHDNPRFCDLVEDWSYNSFGKNVIIGTAAYKQNVYEELNKQIEFTRSSNSSGVAFFRYSNIKKIEFEKFEEKVLPAKMPWIVLGRNLPTISLTINDSINHNSSINISWEFERTIHEARYLTLYEVSDLSDLKLMKLLKVLPSSSTSTNVSLNFPNKVVYNYTTKTVDRLWNESEENNIVSYKVPELKEVSDQIAKFDKPLLSKINDQHFLLFSSNRDDQLKIKVSMNKEKLSIISSHNILPGLNILEVDSEILGYNIIKLEFINSQRVVELKK